MASTALDDETTTTTTAAATAPSLDDQPSAPPDLPMSMTASIVLTNLPRDTTQALHEVDGIDDFKVPVRFSALPSAPALGKQKVFKISASQRFEAVVNFLRKRLAIRENETLFCYVNSVFAPGLDEGVGNLFRVIINNVFD